jgi:hypothetical protein
MESYTKELTLPIGYRHSGLSSIIPRIELFILKSILAQKINSFLNQNNPTLLLLEQTLEVAYRKDISGYGGTKNRIIFRLKFPLSLFAFPLESR